MGWKDYEPYRRVYWNLKDSIDRLRSERGSRTVNQWEHDLLIALAEAQLFQMFISNGEPPRPTK